jgi:hypothetical protein
MTQRVSVVVLAAWLAACGGKSVIASDAGVDGAVDAGTDAGTDAGLDAGIDAGADAGFDAGADAGFDAGTDAALDAGTDAGFDAGVDAGPPMVADLDFEGMLPPTVAPVSCDPTPSQGYEPLGTEGNRFGPTFLRCLTGGVITVTIDDLPAHTALDIDFLFAAIDSLDGEGTFPAGDFFRVDLDGVTIFREAFANALPSQIQTYDPLVPEIVLARRVDLGFSGPGGFYTDSAYDFSLDPTFSGVPHTASRAVLTFTLEGAGVQSLDDESWAIDNVRVQVR